MNRNRFFNIPFLLTSAILFFTSGCVNYKDIPYFQNSAEYDGAGKGSLYDMTIKPKDLLTIFVTSSNPDGVAQFNVWDPRPISESLNGNIRAGQSRGEIHHYLVENDGTIDFPVVGRIHLAGMTIPQANATILEKISPYLQNKSDCIVNTLIENYEISVLGEVKSPNTFTISRNKCTVLEALAMAGDMTIYGKRDNVKILRQLPDGTYAVHELDMRDANILNSPYYYLHQRDIVYVEPNVVMAQNSKISRTTQLWLRGVSITISLGSLLYRVID